jgi:uncharacterized protein
MLRATMRFPSTSCSAVSGARRRFGTVWIGWLEFDLLLGDVRSLKEKRSLVRPIIAELQRRFNVAAAETGALDLHRRAGVGLAVVAADRQHVVDVLDAAERLVAARPEVELLSVGRRLRRSDDD